MFLKPNPTLPPAKKYQRTYYFIIIILIGEMRLKITEGRYYWNTNWTAKRPSWSLYLFPRKVTFTT